MNLSIPFFLRGAAVALACLVAISACTVVVDEPGADPGPGPGPNYCTREYDGVLRREAQRGTQNIANACLADRSGYNVVRQGRVQQEAEKSRASAPGNTGQCVPASAVPSRTFPNACEADVAGWRVVDRGPC